MTMPPLSPSAARPIRLRRPMLWAALVSLLVVAQTALVLMTLRYEEARAQERADEAANAVASELRHRSQQILQGLQMLGARKVPADDWRQDAQALMRTLGELARVERRGVDGRVTQSTDSPFRTPLFQHWPRAELQLETELACAAALRAATPQFARSQFVPMQGGLGVEVVDVCIGQHESGQHVGFVVGSIVLSGLLEEIRPAELSRQFELSFVESDGTRLARAGSVRGAGVYSADRIVDLPGNGLQLRVDAMERKPGLIPNLAVALVLGLSLALAAVVVLLVHDVRRRARAEGALAEALAFRKAMEDSLITGVRARDRSGRIVHVNPAFCAMVGYPADELVAATVPPYWPPEHVATYQQRQAERLNPGADFEPSREGYETVFMRKGGERFPVMVYEAPLLDSVGKHTGWMSTVVDVSAQRRMEDLSRQQQERLQATARLASVGEMASLLSHELNQPLSAIASYATGSINLMERPDGDTPALLQQAMQRIAEQAERAGRVIKSVHNFVRRRDQAHEVLGADVLIESVMPLVRLQARKSGARIEVDVSTPAPRVKVDRTMLEQVLLNLTRNGLQAMEGDMPVAERVLTIRAHITQVRWVAFSVTDTGAGVPSVVAQQLFTPFFTTKGEGMGLGLSLCRTVIEQHGGVIDFENLPRGAAFRFTLPLAALRSAEAAA
ncbi:MAG: PAS domain S-box protein [Ideonella sp.]|nr:PAS domain S-box protein [Ideonella sp.]